MLEDLSQTKYWVTEALHRAIVADILRIPWRSVRSSASILRLKWQDWHRSPAIKNARVLLPPSWASCVAAVSVCCKACLKRRQIEGKAKAMLCDVRVPTSSDKSMQRILSVFDEHLALLDLKYGSVQSG